MDPVTGVRMVCKVWRREELFEGPHLDRIPDLLLEVVSPSQFGIHQGDHDGPGFRKLTREEIATLVVSGDHRMEGTLILCGPGIRPGASVTGAEIPDVFPTVLYMMRESIPAQVDGQVILDAFLPQWLDVHPPTYSSINAGVENQDLREYSEVEQSEIEEHLAGLGYMD